MTKYLKFFSFVAVLSCSLSFTPIGGVTYAAQSGAQSCVDWGKKGFVYNKCNKPIYVHWLNRDGKYCSKHLCMTNVGANSYSTIPPRKGRINFAACFQPERALGWEPLVGDNKYSCGILPKTKTTNTKNSGSNPPPKVIRDRGPSKEEMESQRRENHRNCRIEADKRCKKFDKYGTPRYDNSCISAGARECDRKYGS